MNSMISIARDSLLKFEDTIIQFGYTLQEYKVKSLGIYGVVLSFVLICPDNNHYPVVYAFGNDTQQLDILFSFDELLANLKDYASDALIILSSLMNEQYSSLCITDQHNIIQVASLLKDGEGEDYISKQMNLIAGRVNN